MEIKKNLVENENTKNNSQTETPKEEKIEKKLSFNDTDINNKKEENNNNNNTENNNKSLIENSPKKKIINRRFRYSFCTWKRFLCKSSIGQK